MNEEMRNKVAQRIGALGQLRWEQALREADQILSLIPTLFSAEEKEETPKDIEELDLHEMSIKTPCGVDADSKCYILEKKINEIIRWTKSAEKERKNI